MFWRRGRHKYNATKVAIDGKTFASKSEGNRYLVLRGMEQAGTIKNLVCQPKFAFPMGFSYIPDFMYESEGRLCVEDVKGMETPEFKLKAKCFVHFYPVYKFYLVKGNKVEEYKSKEPKK